MGCIVLLILFGGIGLFLLNSNEDNRTLETTEKENEITEKIVYKILKNNDYNYYSLNNENKENLEELGEYLCESKECMSIVSYNDQDAKFIVYDNGYRFISLENNKINVQELEELNKEEINTIYHIGIREENIFIKYRDDTMSVYSTLLNKMVLEKEKYTDYFQLTDVVFLVDENTSLSIYNKNMDFFQTFSIKDRIMNIEEVKIHDQFYYIVKYISRSSEIPDTIYDYQLNPIIDNYYFNGIDINDNMILTKEYPNIYQGGINMAGYLNIKEFETFDVQNHTFQASKNYLSIMNYVLDKETSKILYFFAIDENNKLALYDLKEEKIVEFPEEWNEQKRLCIGDTYKIGEFLFEYLTIPNISKENTIIIHVGGDEHKSITYYYNLLTQEMNSKEFNIGICLK